MAAGGAEGGHTHSRRQRRERPALVGHEPLVVAILVRPQVDLQQVAEGVPLGGVQPTPSRRLDGSEVVGGVGFPVDPLVATRELGSPLVEVVVEGFKPLGRRDARWD